MSTETASKTYVVPCCNISGLAKKIAHLTRRAVKLGCPPVAMTTGASYAILLKRDGRVIRDEFIDVCDVTVSGEAPSFNGWTFAAVVDHDGEENIVLGVGDVTIPDRFRTTPPRCEHCKLARRRSGTFVVHNASTDCWMQIGRTCLKDFLGHDDPSTLAAMATMLAEACRDCEEFEEGFGLCGKGDPGIERYLSVVAAVIRTQGWVSKSRCGDEQIPTCLIAANIIYEGRAKGLVTDSDCERAEAALLWARSLSDAEIETNDYLANVRACAKRPSVSSRHQGITASIVSTYDRVMAERLMAAVSKHVGEVGKRMDFVLTVTKVISIDSFRYGTSYLHIMVDADGNCVTWKASGHTLETGATYKVKGTVKEHGSREGTLQTKLSRCKAEKLDSR